MRTRYRACLLASVVALAGCEGVLPGIDWQQMIDQAKYQPFEACRFFADGRAMQSPPEGTVPRDRLVGEPALTTGVVDGKYVADIPLPLTPALFADGRLAFDTYCAACHGLDGSGESEVARNMELRKPPSLLAEPVRSFPPGRIFQVASEGYGLMPAYSLELDVPQLWSVVAYVRALELSQAAELDRLPADLRAAAEQALPDVKGEK